MTKALGITALVGLLVACAVLPVSKVPVCAWDPDVVCRAPGIAALFGARDWQWEHRELCPAKTDLHSRACYVYAGTLGARQLYVYRVFDGQP